MFADFCLRCYLMAFSLSDCTCKVAILCVSPYFTLRYLQLHKITPRSIGICQHVSFLCVVAAQGMMAAGGPRPGMQQQLQEGWVASASASPMGQSGPAQQGVMQGRIGANTAPMRATSQPRPMLHSPMMANGERYVSCNYTSLYTKYYILNRDDNTT